MKDLTSQKFGRLTVLRFDRREKTNSYWLCECECGNIKNIRGNHLITGHTKSCGCLSQETNHGMRIAPEYEAWKSMKQRCLNKNNLNYKNYGGRGITICKRWEKFINFYKDMGDRPERLSLERINNNGNYEPSNCKWSTQKEQSRNTRKNVNITYKGKTQCLMAWSEETGIKYITLWQRLKKLNWLLEEAFETPVK